MFLRQGKPPPISDVQEYLDNLDYVNIVSYPFKLRYKVAYISCNHGDQEHDLIHSSS